MAIDIQSLMKTSLSAATSIQEDNARTAQQQAAKVIPDEIKQKQLEEEMLTNLRGTMAKTQITQQLIQQVLAGMSPDSGASAGKYNFNLGTQ